MAERFSAFSFVDRITELEPGRRATGRFTVPAALPDFPSCLVAEAVGQLAAWAAMAYVEFRRLPVAGLAGKTAFFGTVKPGQRLDLEVEIESCDDEAVAYGGCARIDAVKVLEIAHCVGPMLPLEQFDAAEVLRARLRLLCDAGAPEGRFSGVARPQLTAIERGVGELHATLQVPPAAPFFADHFPRRPVFPGTLLLDSQIRLAQELATPLVPRELNDVKIRSFVAPGQLLQLHARMLPPAASAATVTMSALVDGKSISTARLELGSRDKS